MCTNLLSRTLAAAGLTLLLAGCAGLPEAYPPPANPFLTDAPPLASTTLAQPAKVGLVWLAPVGSAVPPQAAQQNLVDKIKAQFAAGKRQSGVSRHRSEEHTSELQSRQYLVCRLLLEKKKQ